jgi:dihydroflavonol-4-reductase
VKSKTLAERAAWDFAAQHPDGPELTVINPVGIFGPVHGGDLASSVGIIQILLHDKLPLVPRSSFAVVDVRDVAILHVTAMVSPRAAGERFLAAARFVAPLEGLAALPGKPKPVSTAKAASVLGWHPRPTADTVADTGQRLLAFRPVASR